ncbi:MAG: MarR family winged helix-turn-helix transcriptional regulator [Bacillota bacterium]
MIKDKELKLMEETDLIFRSVWKKYQYFLMPKDIDLSMHQILFLKYLKVKGTCTPSEIAQQLRITLGAVTGFVDRLYKLGLITRTHSEEDRRVILIQLSPKGIEPLNAFEKERELKFARIFEKLNGLQVAELKKALEQLNIVLDDLTLANKE